MHGAPQVPEWLLLSVQIHRCVSSHTSAPQPLAAHPSIPFSQLSIEQQTVARCFPGFGEDFPHLLLRDLGRSGEGLDSNRPRRTLDRSSEAPLAPETMLLNIQFPTYSTPVQFSSSVVSYSL